LEPHASPLGACTFHTTVELGYLVKTKKKQKKKHSKFRITSCSGLKMLALCYGEIHLSIYKDTGTKSFNSQKQYLIQLFLVKKCHTVL
jgi:hypothetical protein